MQHLVIEQVFNSIARAGGAIKNSAHNDSVVGSVIMAERASGKVLAPGQLGSA